MIDNRYEETGVITSVQVKISVTNIDGIHTTTLIDFNGGNLDTMDNIVHIGMVFEDVLPVKELRILPSEDGIYVGVIYIRRSFCLTSSGYVYCYDISIGDDFEKVLG